MAHTTPEQDNKYMNTFNKMIQAYQTQAVSLLEEDVITQTTEEEKRRFEHAKEQSLPLSRLLGNNTARYVKDLIRRRQPFFALYSLINILSEGAWFLLLYSALRQAFCWVFLQQSTVFSTSFSVDYILITLTGLLVCRWLYHRAYRNKLLDATTIVTSQVKLQSALFGILGSCFAGCILWVLSAITHISHLSCTLQQSALIYVAMMFIAGVHNVIYNSHLPAFFQVGRSMLRREPVVQTQHYISIYTDKCLSQYPDMKTSQLRSRLVSNRVYYFFAMTIALAGCILCIAQIITHPLTPVMLLCTVAFLLITGILVLCIRICGRIIHTL